MIIFGYFDRKLFSYSFEYQKIRNVQVTFKYCKNILSSNKAANIYQFKSTIESTPGITKKTL